VSQAPDRVARVKRSAVLSAPVAVPASMILLFDRLDRRLPAPTAYNVGFAAYWLGWCTAFPLWVLGPRRAWELLRSADRRPSWEEKALMALPVAGAIGTALLPNRAAIDAPVAAVMVGTAALNATGEELLWRGVFLDQFAGDPVRGAAWPLVGFALWHLAPQRVLPASVGRWPFVAGAALVGAGSTVTAWRTRGLRHVLAWHWATDACGVAPARFRLARRG
jgi:membrane protease YdiL (CAAX protease family)